MDLDTLLDAWRQGDACPISCLVAGRPVPWLLTVSDENRLVWRGGGMTLVMHLQRRADLRLLRLAGQLRADRTLAGPLTRLAILDVALPTAPRTLHGSMAEAGLGSHEWGDTVPPPEHAHTCDAIDTPIAWEERDGRCSYTRLPMWVLHEGDGGCWFGPEWGGTWRLEVAPDRLRLLLPEVDAQLHQGEEIALPGVALGTYHGSHLDGRLALRNAIAQDFRPASRPAQPPAVYQILGGINPQLSQAGLENEMDIVAGLGLDTCIFSSTWMRHPATTTSRLDDAQLRRWFPWAKDRAAYINQSWWENMGDYQPAEVRFAGGFAAFRDRLRARGIALGLWYDPRLHVASRDAQRWSHACTPGELRHPRDCAWDAGLVDTGRAEGRAYLLELADRLVALGATVLWHDLNSEPQQRYWNHDDEPGRRGLAELRYWAGMFAVYDEILRRHPQVQIEWCGSGGTMINLGILRRTHLMWLTDKADLRCRPGHPPDSERARAVRSGVLWMLPADRVIHTLYPRGLDQAPSSPVWPAAVVQLGSVLALGQTLTQVHPQALADLGRVVAVYHRIKHLLGAWFWGLAEGAVPSAEAWDGWQFHDPATGSGVLILFRPPAAPATWRMRPRWLPAQVRWEPLLGTAQLTAEGDGWNVGCDDAAAVVAYAPA